MTTIAAGRFKARCLSILDHVGPRGIVITKRGRPVARLLPIGRGPKELLGSLKGKIRVTGPILSTGRRWNVRAES